MARRRPAEPTANPARGAVLVVVAVVIGLLLLRNGIDSSTSASADRGDTSTDEGADAGTDDGATDDGTTDTSAPVLRPPAEVRVVVLNDSGVNGAAGRFSTALGGVGYQLVNQGGDATNPGNSPATQVLYTEGFDQEAQAVATLLQVPATGVQPLGTAVPGDVADANVIVVLGTDLGSTTPSLVPG